jgi:hypothetical protein
MVLTSERHATSETVTLNNERERPDMQEEQGEDTTRNKEDAYWREQHPTQPYADPQTPYEHYAPAYRVGYEAAQKHGGKDFEEIETDLALDYEKAAPESPLPWDMARPAVKAAWDRMSGVIGPRDPDRGIRTGL